uniref:Uncharacterized protein n=1 Tax=Oryza glaberrima TaxID=4538 RepID=I1QVN5_ORYGL
MEANPISGLPSLRLVAAGSRIGGHPPGFCKINARGSTISLQNVAVGKVSRLLSSDYWLISCSQNSNFET